MPADDSTRPAGLTVESAASAILSLNSPKENPEPKVATPAVETEEVETPTEVSDETEQTDTEGEPEEPADDSAEEQTEETDTTSEPRKFKVKVDGQELEVTEEDLLKGYSRTEDYTRKTQKLAEERKTHEAELQAVRDERKQYAERLTLLEQALESTKMPEPDWDTLRQSADPSEFAVAWAEWHQQQETLKKVADEKAKAVAKVQEDQQKHMQEYVRSEQTKLVEAIPAWKDAEVAKKEMGELSEYAKTIGFTEEQLAAVTDHRVVVMLRKAKLFDDAEKAKPAIRQTIEKVKAVTPGPAKQVRQVSDETKARQKLAKTGRVEDAAAAILHMSRAK